MNLQYAAAKSKSHVLLIAIVIIFFLLLFRDSGLYVMVAPDESFYSIFSRLRPLAESVRPNYLFSFIYRLTNSCGSGFLDCARILNTLFFVATAPFIYLTARQVCSAGAASFIAILSLLGPINAYTAYFMPEAMYFFGFWLYSWFVLQLDDTAAAKSWALCGALLGLLALIKPHALFLLPATAIYIVYLYRHAGDKWLLRAIGYIFTLAAACIGTKWLIGFALAGKNGVNLFASYNNYMPSGLFSVAHVMALLSLTLQSTRGHLQAICLLFSVPMAFSLIAVFRLSLASDTKPEHRIQLFTVVTLLTLVVIACLFTASVAGTGPYETVYRLHQRYYDFAFPLLLIVAASLLSDQAPVLAHKWRIAAALPVAIVILYALHSHMALYLPSIVDGPEIEGLLKNPHVFTYAGWLSLCCLVLWVYSMALGGRVFIYGFLPLALAFSYVGINDDLTIHHTADQEDKTGLFTAQYLSQDARAHTIVMLPAAYLGQCIHIRFYFDDKEDAVGHCVRHTMPDASSTTAPVLPPGTQWLLVRDDEKRWGPAYEVKMYGYKLIHLVP